MTTDRPIVGLIGHKRSGKDSLAQFLVAEHGYTRVSFADPLKRAALIANPLITWDYVTGLHMYLADLVARYGWEHTKDQYPEARHFLQHLGEGIRALEPDFWLDKALDTIDVIDGPVVVTDVRFLNEADALANTGYGATLVRILRGDADISAALDTHVSEHELDGYATDLVVDNNGAFALLQSAAQGVAAAASAHTQHLNDRSET
jgi:hypothetical protein